MRTVKLLVWIMIIAALTVMVGGGAIAQEATSSVRFVHVIPGVAGLDVYVNGNLTAANITYGEATDYLDAPVGDLSIRVTLAGVSSTLWQQTTPLPADTALTLIASAADPLAFDVFDESLDSLAIGTTRFNVIHAVNGGGSIDIVAEGQTIATGHGYRSLLGPIDAPTATYTFTVLPEGGSVDTPLLAPITLGMAGRTSYMVVLHGPASAPVALVLSTAVTAPADAGYIRFMHGAEGAPNVDITIDDVLVAPSVSFGSYTAHIPVEAGSHEVVTRVAGGGTVIDTATVEVTSGGYQTIAAIGSIDDLTVAAVEDSVAGVEPASTVFGLINGVPGTLAGITLEDGREIFSGVAFADGSAASFEPTRTAFSLNISAGTVNSTSEIGARTLYGGVYYNLLVVRENGNFSVIVAPTALTRNINSAPGGSGQIAAEVVPTEAPAQPTAPTEVVSAPTPTPSAPEQPTAQSVLPVAPTSPGLPTARVVLDPGANLQLREYPRSDARSLGLAPNGTVFAINGRVGAPIDILTGDEIALPDGTDFVDPVSLLEDDRADLEPSETWLNVTLTTPDGAVTAWINALYVDVRNPRGEQQKLRDLPTVPQNQPGSSEGSVVTTPAPPQNVAEAVVFNLDPGVGLNIRRTAESGGEILARMLTGEKAELVGFGESGEWAFVNYATPEGGSVRGWAATTYLRYEFRGRPIDLDEMITRGLLDEVDELTLRGSVTAGTAPLVQPTLDPLRGVNVAQVVGLDAGVQLNMRRTPDTSAEVLLRIPSGSTMRVISRTGSDAWLEVEFDGTTGWVASLYTVLSFNGRPITIADIPVSETFSATATPTPTLAPTVAPES